MSELANYCSTNMAELSRLAFIEQYPAEVGATALSRYVEVVPEDGRSEEVQAAYEASTNN